MTLEKICNYLTQTLVDPHMEGSVPHMDGFAVSNPWVLRDQGRDWISAHSL